MNIILSAYACEPNKGSEPGVGWEWVRHLCAKHTLWVVTRSNNRNVIESARHELPSNVHFIYVDLPKALSSWKRGNRGVNLYYFLWQLLAWRRCRPLVGRHKIDLAHHVTLMSVTRFSFVPLLGIPCIVGPVGGLQTCPQGTLSLIRHRVREYVRELSIRLLRYNPFFVFGASEASCVVLATRSGKEHLSMQFRNSRVAYGQIGAVIPAISTERRAAPTWLTGKFCVLWSGRLEDHKGLEILIRAAALIQRDFPATALELQIVVTGKGPERDYYLSLIHQLGVGKFFHFAGWLCRDDYESLWQQVDVFAFTSLRETTGVVLQEAMLRSKPSVVVVNGGPADMINPETGILVEPKSIDALIKGFASALCTLHHNPKLRGRLGANARQRAIELYSWPNVAARMNEMYAQIGSN